MKNRSILLLAACLTLFMNRGHSSRAAEAEAAPAPSAAPKPTAEQVRFFELQVRPVLVENCFKCHGPEKQKGNLRLDSLAAVLNGGDLGPAVVPGNVEESMLLTAIGYADESLKMPPSKKLDPARIAGPEAVGRDGRTLAGKRCRPRGLQRADGAQGKGKGEYQIKDSDRAHWAFQPVRAGQAPAVRNPGWVKNPIDAFILAGLEARGLKPSPPATRRELIRRATFDLIGLPPSPEEIDAFENDPSPEAYDDGDRPSARIASLWREMGPVLARPGPVRRDQQLRARQPQAQRLAVSRLRDRGVQPGQAVRPFVREQIAGDELENGGPDAIIATGYYRLGIWDDEPTDRDQAFYDSVDDIVATTGQVFLGLTIDCARCHDHKLDPIPQKDYYRLVSFFRNINHFRNGGPTDEMPLLSDPEARRAYEIARRAPTTASGTSFRSSSRPIENDFRRRYREDQGIKLANNDLDELTYKFYRDTWDQLPDFNGLKPEETGSLCAARSST